MAGSLLHRTPEDPILSARLQALTLLANNVVEPVLILTPDLELLYANASARQFSETCPLFRKQGDWQSTIPSNRSDPCYVCPALGVLETPQETAFSPTCEASSEEGLDHCPFPESFPLSRQNGELGCILMLGKSGRETMIFHEDLKLLNSRFNSGQIPRNEEGFPDLIGESPVMQQLWEMIQLVSASQATVLLQGESGTGKELVARTIHRLSRRRDQPFIVVDCGALPETLLESELFGHVRGAFTGAVADRQGLFEAAHGGTIFLDEIGDTSPVFQAKLLRVLQEGEIKPVGSNQSIKVDVRVISASNKTLADMVKAKTFRNDLFYRLSVLPLELPPLRARGEDIPLLVDHFLRQACARHGKVQVSLHPDLIQKFIRRRWPGNVRELEHFLERLVLTARNSVITEMDCEGSLEEDGEETDVEGDNFHLGVQTAKAKEEKSRILRALSQSDGNKTKAAKILNISRASFYNKLRQYHIS